MKHQELLLIEGSEFRQVGTDNSLFYTTSLWWQVWEDQDSQCNNRTGQWRNTKSYC